MMQQSKNVGQALGETFKQASSIFLARKGVAFASKMRVTTFRDKEQSAMITYSS
jgi:hypothetical protein